MLVLYRDKEVRQPSSTYKNTMLIQRCCPGGELLAAMLILTAKYITTVMLGTTDPEKTTE